MCVATSLSFTVHEANCSGATYNLIINGVVVATRVPSGECSCDASPETVTTSTDPVALALVKGCNDAFAVVHENGEGVYLARVEVNVAYSSGLPATICVHDAMAGGGCSPRPLCDCVRP